MPFKKVNSKPLNLLLAMLFLQATSYITVLFDIPVARQILLFTYLTFVPGYLIVKLLKFSFEPLETLVFSIGFGVAFLMLVGLALNELGFMAGLSQPLSAIPLIVVLNNVILTAALLTYLKKERSEVPCVSFGFVKWIMPLLVPLILSVVGAVFVGVYGDNCLLLLMILAISLVAAFLTLKSKVPSVAYALAVFIIGVSLLFHSSLASKYITTFGSDVSLEHFVFKNTLENGFWSSVSPAYWHIGLGRLNGMLSITVLPTVYSNLLNLDSTWVFKLVFPLIFVFVPLCLYLLWKKSFGVKWAFVSVFFFMATTTFYTELLGLNRQMIAELFFALLLFVLLDKRMNGLQRMFSFTIFSFGLVVSHYGIAEIFLFLIVFALVCLLVFKRRINNLTVGMVVLFFVIMFVWYIYTSNASVFESLLDFGEHVYQQLGEFFNLESRGETVLRGLGLENPPTIWNAISRFFAYATEFLIVVGFACFLLKRKNIGVGLEHFILTSEAMGILLALIIVPGLASTMNMTRFYHVLLFLLAPLCVLGARFLVERILKRKSEMIVSVLLLLVLTPYFLFQSSFVYEIVKADSWSVPLSGYRMDAYKLYFGCGFTDGWSVSSVTWIRNNVDVGRIRIYGDSASYENTLRTYGIIYEGYIYPLSNVTSVSENGIIYLNSLNVLNGKVIAWSYVCNSTELYFLNNMYLVYSNGGSEIYKNVS